MNTKLKEKLDSIPHRPGCYIWKGNNNKILYIGKAKDLKNRTSQYFSSTANYKTKLLVEKIVDIDIFVVSNENESLILESNLIKQHKPPYNILLKEGSNHPYIVVTDEKNPRILYTRKYNKFKGKYYGPFANNSDYNAYSLYLLLNRIFPLRKCKTVPEKECIFYHMNQCLAPCIKEIKNEEYQLIKDEINNIFNNKIKDKLEEFRKKEINYSNELKFEQAQIYKEYIEQLKKISKSQIVQLQHAYDIDVIGHYEHNGNICIMIFNYLNGKLISKHEMVSEYFDDVDEVVASYINQYYENNNIPKKIYINLDESNLNQLSIKYNCNVIKPLKGLYLDLLTSAIDNAKEYISNNKLTIEDKYNRTIGAQEELRKLLNLDELNHIEAIDNSNLFLENPVSGVVVFKNGLPDKKSYRKYNLYNSNIKSDYHFMQEVINRKYSKTENFPDLLIVDGGLIELRAAKKVLNELGLDKTIYVIGLQKDKNHKTSCIINMDEEIIELNRKSYLYSFLSFIQEEVHRFAISFYRQKNHKSMLSTFLDDIDGLGEKSKKKIIKLYPNIYDLRNVELTTIEQIIPKKAAKNLKLKIDKELVK